MNPRPQGTLQQQFKTTNFIGLAMIASVFIYAGIVLGIDKGFIPLKPRPALDNDTLTTIRYILLAIALAQYWLIRFFRNFALKSLSYLRRATSSSLPFAKLSAFTA